MRFSESLKKAFLAVLMAFLPLGAGAGVIIDKTPPAASGRVHAKAYAQPSGALQDEVATSGSGSVQRRTTTPQAERPAAAPEKNSLKPVAAATPRGEHAYTHMSLTQVVRLIVPKDWKGYARDKRIGTLTNLSWKPSGRPWPAELEDVLHKTGISASLNWTRKEVEFRVADPSAFRKYAAKKLKQ